MAFIDMTWRTYRPAEGFYTSEVEAPRRLPVHVVFDRADGAFEHVAVDVFEDNVESSEGADVCDAPAHLPRADNSHPFDVHNSV